MARKPGLKVKLDFSYCGLNSSRLYSSNRLD